MNYLTSIIIYLWLATEDEAITSLSDYPLLIIYIRNIAIICIAGLIIYMYQKTLNKIFKKKINNKL